MKQLIFITILIASVYFLPRSVMAEKISGESAQVTLIQVKYNSNAILSRKKLVMSKVLQNYNSPLSSEVAAFLSTCISYELDCYLLPSIAGIESGFGKFVYPNSNNPFGWGGGMIMFQSWQDAIDAVGKGLRQNYINKGAESVDEIALIYAESKTWAPRVKYFMAQFEKEEEKINSFLSKSEVKL